jgi:ubiquinone/menaquinone biosynthesis C-methylase UbiE
VGRVRESGMPEEEYWGSFFDPECILAALACPRVGDIIEFGCGYGHFTLPAAKLTTGTVYALDIDPAMIERTAGRVHDEGLTNVVTIDRDFVADGCGRPNQSAAYVMLFNILHIENPVALLREAWRVLAPGGRVGVIHWNVDARTPRGPSMAIRPRPEQCCHWAEEAGLRFVRFDELRCCAWHWGMLVERPTA